MPFVGEIAAFNTELPRGWLPCDGRELEIQRHVVLYSVIEDKYGGDGRVTFKVPDMRGRVTAGADPRRKQHPGATSGRTGDEDDAIPYRVVRWGINVEGYYPARD